MFFNIVSPACQRHSRIEESSSLNSFALNSKNPDLLKTKGTAAQDRVQPALAVVVASSLIVSSFPSINSIFSHAWHFLFLKGNSWSQVSSPGCQLLTFGVRSFQRPNARYPTCRKKNKNALCHSELSATKKRETDVWCNDWSFVSPRAATTLER